MYSYIFPLIQTIEREEEYMPFNRGMKSGQESHSTFSALFYLRMEKMPIKKVHDL